MIMHLFQEKYLQDVMLALSEAGIDNCIVLTGESLSNKLMYDIPIFSTFRDSMGNSRGYGNIISGKADKEAVEFFLKEIKLAGIDFIEKEIGKIYLVPISMEF